MAGLTEEAKDAMREIVGSMESIECTVVSVDEESLTCDCKPIEEGSPNYPTVRLSTSKDGNTYVFPKVGSNVIIKELSDNGDAYIALIGEIDFVAIRGTNEGGLIKIENLVSELDKVNDAINNLLDIFTQWVPVPTDGGAALKALLTPQIPIIKNSLPTYSDIENEKVKHGSN